MGLESVDEFDRVLSEFMAKHDRLPTWIIIPYRKLLDWQGVDESYWGSEDYKFMVVNGIREMLTVRRNGRIENVPILTPAKGNYEGPIVAIA